MPAPSTTLTSALRKPSGVKPAPVVHATPGPSSSAATAESTNPPPKVGKFRPPPGGDIPSR
eukprot:9698813-Prorocentrum_lima.AAC.1